MAVRPWRAEITLALVFQVVVTQVYKKQEMNFFFLTEIAKFFAKSRKFYINLIFYPSYPRVPPLDFLNLNYFFLKLVQFELIFPTPPRARMFAFYLPVCLIKNLLIIFAFRIVILSNENSEVQTFINQNIAKLHNPFQHKLLAWIEARFVFLVLTMDTFIIQKVSRRIFPEVPKSVTLLFAYQSRFSSCCSCDFPQLLCYNCVCKLFRSNTWKRILENQSKDK